VDEARVALLRLLMRRITSVRLEAPMPGLDESYDNPAYLAGRIFAVLESVQRAAYPRDDAPNTTFFHRYFSGAVTNPAIAVTQGLQLFPAWLKKIEGRAGTRGPKSPGMAASFALRSRLTNLHDRYEAASNGVPRRMDIEQQGAFVLGYFHQSAHDQQAARDARTAKAEVDAEA
jgi:CRISPR-associated protein Csd1